MTRVAYLRVYLPMEALGPEERRRWEFRAGPTRIDPLPFIAVTDYGLLSEPLGDDAIITEWSGSRFVCPRNPRLRILEGVLAFHNAYPGSRLVPEEVVRRAASELERIRRFRPRARSHILTAPWHVPLRWFAAFSPDEREIREAKSGPVIRYRTVRSWASRRLLRAVEALEEAGFDDDVIEEVQGLAEWLEDFSPEAMVELDYAGVAGLFNPGDLAMDESAADVWASLEALERGDFEEATLHYTSAATRWAEAQAVTYSN